MRKAIFTCIIALAALVQTAWGQPGRITGRVIGNRDQPVGNAIVMLTGAGGNEVLQTVISNASGEFLLENLPEGSYRVHVSAQGYDFRNSNVIEITEAEVFASLGVMKLPKAGRLPENGITGSSKRKHTGSKTTE